MYYTLSTQLAQHAILTRLDKKMIQTARREATVHLFVG